MNTHWNKNTYHITGVAKCSKPAMSLASTIWRNLSWNWQILKLTEIWRGTFWSWLCSDSVLGLCISTSKCHSIWFQVRSKRCMPSSAKPNKSGYGTLLWLNLCFVESQSVKQIANPAWLHQFLQSLLSASFLGTLLSAHTDRIVGEACLEDHVLKLTPSDPVQGGKKAQNVICSIIQPRTLYSWYVVVLGSKV